MEIIFQEMIIVILQPLLKKGQIRKKKEMEIIQIWFSNTTILKNMELRDVIC